MLEREPYEPRSYGMTTGNEPPINYTIEIDTRRYPDMYYAYEVFSRKFHIGTDRFILANGGENAIKNTLLALKPKSMFWTKPTWRMLEVYCEALDIKPINQEFELNLNYNTIKFFETEYTGKEKIDVFYDCNGKSSTLTYYKDYIPEKYYKKFKWVVVDITYSTIESIHYAIENIKKYDNVILVGSFDKLFGCGLRLGFAIFPESLSKKMQLQREQYINPAAVNFLLNGKLETPKLEFYDKLVEDKFIKDIAICLNRSYLVIQGSVNCTLPHTTFHIEGHPFTRFGIPYTKEEYDQLMTILKMRSITKIW